MILKVAVAIVALLAACWALAGYGVANTAFLDLSQRSQLRPATIVLWLRRLSGLLVLLLAGLAGVMAAWAFG